MRFIFITGGVVSSVGKGIAAASIGALLQSKGYKVRLRKMDPYLNIDPGTMSPSQHGEVFVTEDGAETDLDLGHYERFTGVNCTAFDSVSSGQINDTILKRERKGDYLGSTVQIIPHVTDEIKRRIELDLYGEDFVICEIGGTVGDIEATPFLEAIRQFANDKGRAKVLFIHVTLLPYLRHSGEVKTKPTQHSVRELQRSGITPNILLCRTEVAFGKEEAKKLALFCNVNQEDIIPALNCNILNQVIVNYHKEGLDSRIFHYFNSQCANNQNINSSKNANNELKANPKTYNKESTVNNIAPLVNNGLQLWEDLIKKEQAANQEINLYIVAKYLKNKDAYISLEAALKHAAVVNSVKLNLNWVDAESLENTNDLLLIFKNANGIFIPGGYGIRGTEGKIRALEYARKNNIPTLGICLGAQLMVIEILRNVAGLKNTGSSEFGNYQYNAVSLLTEWQKEGILEKRGEDSELGGSMRLGSFPCKIKANTLASTIYQKELINERHRHRYEINANYQKQLEASGIIISGISPDGVLPEIIELKNHPFFLGVQFHPEFKSRPFAVHPIFFAFIKAQLQYLKEVENSIQ